MNTEIRFCDRCMMKRIHEIVEEEDNLINYNRKVNLGLIRKYNIFIDVELPISKPKYQISYLTAFFDMRFCVRLD